MPNWCTNELTVSGNAKEIKRFVEANMGLPAQYPLTEWEKKIVGERPAEDTPYFTFNALIPTPKEVLELGYDAHDKIPLNTQLLAAIGQETGPLDGYHWNIVHWGTKWDVYSDHIDA